MAFDRLDRRVHVVRVADGSEVAAIGPRPSWSGAYDFSPDGTMFAAALDDNSITLRRWPSLDETARLRGHTEIINDIRFAHSSKFVVSVGDRRVILWDVSTGKILREMQASPSNSNSPIRLAITPDDRRIFVSVTNFGAEIFDTERGEQVAALRGNTDWWPILSMDGTGRFLATVEGRGVVRLWDSAAPPERTCLREAALAAREIARPMLDVLFTELKEPAAIAARVRTDAALDPEVRREALHLLLGRLHPPQSQTPGQPGPGTTGTN